MDLIVVAIETSSDPINLRRADFSSEIVLRAAAVLAMRLISFSTNHSHPFFGTT